MVQIVHISDLHLIPKGGWRSHVQFLAGKKVPILRNYWTVADPIVKGALRNQIGALVAPGRVMLVLSGDIAAWPTDSAIGSGYINYIESLIPTGSLLLPVLGNHDWYSDKSPAGRGTNFSGTRLDADYNILQPRVHVELGPGLRVIFFLIDSNETMIPATGCISAQTLQFLTDCFDDGHKGALNGLTTTEYELSIKVLILHHSPLSQVCYDGMLPQSLYSKLELTNADDLIKLCRRDIDLFICGHTHVPVAIARDSFVFADGGTTLGLSSVARSPSPGLNLIKILDRNLVMVSNYSWANGRFCLVGSRSFIRKGAGDPYLPKGFWL